MKHPLCLPLDFSVTFIEHFTALDISWLHVELDLWEREREERKEETDGHIFTYDIKTRKTRASQSGAYTPEGACQWNELKWRMGCEWRVDIVHD